MSLIEFFPIGLAAAGIALRTIMYRLPKSEMAAATPAAPRPVPTARPKRLAWLTGGRDYASA